MYIFKQTQDILVKFPSISEIKFENLSYHDVSQQYACELTTYSYFQTSHYRFSISWSRIFTDGTKATYNQAGIDHYNKFIDALVAAGIEPVITLFHFDLPQHLHDQGGWMNKDIIEHFGDYSRACYEAFGDRVS